MSLIQIRALLCERFPRVPELQELSKTVLAAFPHSRWDYPTGAFSNAEPPNIRGLVWTGKDVAEEADEEYERAVRERERAKEAPRIITRARASGKNRADPDVSRSPTQSTLVSPTSSGQRKHLLDTPARSVLEEFAEIATLAEKTPASRSHPLPGDHDLVAPAPAYALANICNSYEAGRKRKSSTLHLNTFSDGQVRLISFTTSWPLPKR